MQVSPSFKAKIKEWMWVIVDSNDLTPDEQDAFTVAAQSVAPANLVTYQGKRYYVEDYLEGQWPPLGLYSRRYRLYPEFVEQNESYLWTDRLS